MQAITMLLSLLWWGSHTGSGLAGQGQHWLGVWSSDVHASWSGRLVYMSYGLVVMSGHQVYMYDGPVIMYGRLVYMFYGLVVMSRWLVYMYDGLVVMYGRLLYMYDDLVVMSERLLYNINV